MYGPSGAPVVVFLHHGLGSVRSGKAQISTLAADYRLIIYDRWGYGKSDAVFYNGFNGWFKLDNQSWDMRQIINNIIRPTLVVRGSDDEYGISQHARHIADSIPGAKLWLVQGACHMLPQEEIEVFNQKLVYFIGQDITKRKQRELV
jgi:pimeloyl-ACP methyl ester carboxylesterase